MRLKQYSKFQGNTFRRHFWWFVLTACLAALLFYGLSFFTPRPTVETITTPAPIFAPNANQMREVDFQAPKKSRRRASGN